MLAVVYTLVIAWALGATTEVLASLAPKTATAPIAIGITEELGGSVSLTAGAFASLGISLTGLFTALLLPLLFPF